MQMTCICRNATVEERYMYGTDLSQLRLVEGSLTLFLANLLCTHRTEGRPGLGLDAFQGLSSRKLSR